MRLLYLDEAHAVRWREFSKQDIPPYAILSHTWEYEEYNFLDLENGTGREKAGYHKVVFCGEQAARDGLEYFWVDTCSIDKRDLLELSKAINSMFRWYSDASKCYVYLSDVVAGEHDDAIRKSEANLLSDIRRSRWFTRGWTLQELIAPSSVEFFSKDCQHLGDKRSLTQTIHAVTGVPDDILQGSPLHSYSIEDRMLWASSRQTTEEEDSAYCLLGLFDVSLPLIYGEGKNNALARLRREIDLKYTDETRVIDPSVSIDKGATITGIRRWLAPPDPSTNYFQAIKQRQSGTGEWFLRSEAFLRCLEGSTSTLWLHGVPGCGKSILSATIIEDLQRRAEKRKDHAVIYFYFVYNDAQKRTPEVLVRSALNQLISSHDSTPPALESCYLSCDKGQRQVTLDTYLGVLQQMISGMSRVDFVIDALDECDDREQLLYTLSAMNGWNAKSLRIILTSRKERDIESGMADLVDQCDMIGVEGIAIDKDIELYVKSRLIEDKNLQKWCKDPAMQRRIESTLAQGSRGMFRWAACQLDALGKCRNRAMLLKSLNSLPASLDSTYERILLHISEEDAIYAVRILRWLAFSARPLTLNELAEAAAIDTDRGCMINEDEVLVDPLDILDICSSLVLSTHVPFQIIGGKYTTPLEDYRGIAFAHYSVQEYLVSQRCLKSPTSRFYLEQQESHQIMAKSCLNILLRCNEEGLDLHELESDHGLILYAAQNWIHHAQKVPDNREVIAQSVKLLSEGSPAFKFWLELHDPDRPFMKWNKLSISRKVVAPLYYASQGNLPGVAEVLIENGADVNAQGGTYGPALVVAAMEGHHEVVKLLLERGADVNARNATRLPFAIRAATIGGYIEIVKLLIEKGADVNAYDVRYGTALHAAVSGGDVQIVELLISKGAHINARNPSANALQVAVINHRPEIAKLLITHGADMNAQNDNSTGNALQIAIALKNVSLVKFMIANGADVNAQGGKYETALQAVASKGFETILEAMIANGARLDIKGGKYGSALQAAAAKGHTHLLPHLLENGVDAESRSDMYRNALQAAIARGQKYTVESLIADGAQSYLSDDELFHAIALDIDAKTVRKILDSGLDCDSPDLHGWTARDFVLNRRDPELEEMLPRDKAASARSERAYMRPTALIQMREYSKTLIDEHGIVVSTEYFDWSELGGGRVLQVRGNHPVPPHLDKAFYEIQVIRCELGDEIGVGFCTGYYTPNGMPGWSNGAWAYHGDDGKLFTGYGNGEPYGPQYAAGDTIGFGVDFRKDELVFTKNGERLRFACKLPRERLFPIVGVGDEDVAFRINFDAKWPFSEDDDTKIA